MNSRTSKRTGIGNNQGALNPTITVLLDASTASVLPSNPKIRDVVIDASTTGSVITYVFDGNDWR